MIDTERIFFILRIYKNQEDEYNEKSTIHVQKKISQFKAQLRSVGIENDEKGLNRIKNNEEYPYWKYNDITYIPELAPGEFE